MSTLAGPFVSLVVTEAHVGTAVGLRDRGVLRGADIGNPMWILYSIPFKSP